MRLGRRMMGFSESPTPSIEAISANAP
jgi:hypothetical protein